MWEVLTKVAKNGSQPEQADDDDDDDDADVHALLRQAEQRVSSDASSDDDVPCVVIQPAAVAQPSAPDPQPPHQGNLPSADSFDMLGDASFLQLPPTEPCDPSWHMNAEEQRLATRQAAAAAAAAAIASGPSSLPINRYGRGLNMLQLQVELSSRAVRGSTSAAAVPKRSVEMSSRETDDGAAPGPTSGESEAERKRRRGGRGNDTRGPTHCWNYEA